MDPREDRRYCGLAVPYTDGQRSLPNGGECPIEISATIPKPVCVPIIANDWCDHDVWAHLFPGGGHRNVPHTTLQLLAAFPDTKDQGRSRLNNYWQCTLGAAGF